MKTYHRQPSARFDQGGSLFDPPHQIVEFTVHRDPQRHERAGGGMYVKFPVVPSKGDLVISAEGNFFTITEIVWEADKFEVAQLKIAVEQKKQLL